MGVTFRTLPARFYFAQRGTTVDVGWRTRSRSSRITGARNRRRERQATVDCLPDDLLDAKATFRGSHKFLYPLRE